MKKYLTTILVLCICTTNLSAQETLSISPEGKILLQNYLSMNVENLWIAGHHVNWITGVPDREGADAGIKTHCSAFVAAVCKNQNTYILRPPEHGQVLLANAQYKWLQSPAAIAIGWHQIIDSSPAAIYYSAQRYANKGVVVIAVYQNSNSKKPGHIAMVRPDNISVQQLSDNGPSIIMASTHNYNLISLKMGFKSHITQWPEPAILFYYNDIKK